MKILQVAPIPISKGGVEKGGVESHVSELSDKLSEVHQIYFFRNKITKLLSNNGAYYRNILDYIICFLLGIKYFIVVDKVFKFKERFKIAADSHRMSKIISEQGIDIVHVHGVHNHACYVCELLTVPYIVTDHGIGHKEAFDLNKALLTRNIAGCKSIIAISKDSYKNLLCLIDKDKIEMINNPIDLPDSNKIDTWENIHFDFALFNGISDTWYRKGLSEIAKNIDSIMNTLKPLHLVIVCDEKNFNKLISKCLEKNNLERIHHYLPMERYRSLGLVKKARFNIAPSIKEGFSIAYLESIGLSTPVIGFYSNIEEMNELFGSKLNIPYEHGVSNLNELVKTMMLNTNQRENFGDISILSWAKSIDKFNKIYSDSLIG